MVYHFLEHYSFFFLGIILGLAVIPPDTCNSGKAFNRQGHVFLVSEDVLSLLLFSEKEE